MPKNIQINTKSILKIPTQGNDVTNLGTNSVGTSHIQDLAVTSNKIQNSPILITPFIETLSGGSATTSSLTLKSTTGVGITGADILFKTGNNGSTEAMRILNSGDIGIGIAAPTTKLHTYLSSNSSIKVAIFENANTGASTQSYIQIGQSATNKGVSIGHDYTGEYGFLGQNGQSPTMFWRANSTTFGANQLTTGLVNLYTVANTANVLYMFKNTQVEATIGFAGSTDTNFYIGTGSSTINTNGPWLTNGGTNWTARSDERLKDIIEPITSALIKVNTLRTVIGKFKADITNTRRPFLIAQDVQQVLPEAISKAGNEIDAMLGVSYTDVIPLLVAAIKELSADFEYYKQAHP